MPSIVGNGRVWKATTRPERLVIMFHGWNRSPSDFESLARRIGSSWPDADIYAPAMRLGLLSTAGAATLVKELLGGIDRIWSAADGAYREIVFVGHSCGAVLLRSVWAIAHGAREDGSVALEEARPWAPRVARVVLLAALNRGYDASAAMTPWMRLGYWLSDLIEAVAGPRLFILQMRRGSAFLTTLRLQWMAVRASLSEEQRPIIVQVLGTVDNVVAPGDNIDLATGDDFFYLESPSTDHLNVVQVPTGSDAASLDRIRILDLAMTGSPEEISANPASLRADELRDMYLDGPNDFDDQAVSTGSSAHSASKVVFVVHGIRDYGFWTKKLAARIKKMAKDKYDGEDCRSVTSTYGFLPMGPFLLSFQRRRRVEWLMDQYVTARALYPNAKFSFVGHSNGTYLLGGALRASPAVKFEQVVLAGSVLPTRFDWATAFKRKQVAGVLNFVATHDWVVAIFPKTFEVLRLQDLGSAGHDGFPDRKSMQEVRYIPGGHGAALADGYWDRIAEYVLDGKAHAFTPSARSRSAIVVALGTVPWLWFLLVAGLFVGVGVMLLAPLGFVQWSPFKLWPSTQWLWAIAFLAWVFIVSRVLTKV